MKKNIIKATTIAGVSLSLLTACRTSRLENRLAELHTIGTEHLQATMVDSISNVNSTFTSVNIDSIVITFVNSVDTSFTFVNAKSREQPQTLPTYGATATQNPFPTINAAKIAIFGIHAEEETQQDLRERAETAIQSTNALKVDTCTTEEKKRATNANPLPSLLLALLLLAVLVSLLLSNRFAKKT